MDHCLTSDILSAKTKTLEGVILEALYAND